MELLQDKEQENVKSISTYKLQARNSKDLSKP